MPKARTDSRPPINLGFGVFLRPDRCSKNPFTDRNDRCHSLSMLEGEKVNFLSDRELRRLVRHEYLGRRVKLAAPPQALVKAAECRA